MFGKRPGTLNERDLDLMSPGEFEEATVRLFQSLGYTATRVGGRNDGGVDVRVHGNGTAGRVRRGVVQCKHREGPAGPAVVRELYGTMQHEGADHGWVVTSSAFTRAALAWATGKPIHLIGRAEFLQLYGRSGRSAPPTAPQPTTDVSKSSEPRHEPQAAASTARAADSDGKWLMVVLAIVFFPFTILYLSFRYPKFGAVLAVFVVIGLIISYWQIALLVTGSITGVALLAYLAIRLSRP